MAASTFTQLSSLLFKYFSDKKKSIMNGDQEK